MTEPDPPLFRALARTPAGDTIRDDDHPPEPEACPHCGGEMDSHDHGRLWHCPECNAERDVDDDGLVAGAGTPTAV